MYLKKAITTVVVLFVLSLLLAACGGGSDASVDSSGESDSGNKTIRFMHSYTEGSTAPQYNTINEIISEFEEDNPDVTIELEVLSNEQYKDKIKVLSTSDELPDVGITWAAGYMKPYVEGNKYAPLDDIYNKDNFVAGTTDPFSMNGNTYGLPLELNIASIYYNKAIFDEYGLEEPETMEELNEIVKTLNENGVNPVALGNKDAWTGSMWYMYAATRLGADQDVITDAINREMSFEDPVFVQAGEEIQKLVENDTFVAGPNGLADEEAKSMFLSGQAAMYLTATWDLANFTTNEDVAQEFRDSVGYFPFPSIDGKGNMNNYVGGPGVGLFVAENSDVKEDAMAFASYLVEQWGDRAVTEVGMVPAAKIDTESMDLLPLYVDILNDLNEAENITLFADVQMTAADAQLHLDMIQALFGGEVTPEEFAKAHEEALSEE
ncbi:extracellular solute-binding protein [Oceanobacillus halophilus]|uniref:Extracellular solute-binding protein n=1 Tax=Oceanobacillus halophilus TaxID=930130 RepID=A0A494ZZW0_9BACI|nr:extracellular solute-binding protein [Oceanobacillus halophilus]RKQ32491.1 extracellular solute-binding protein [Oceanobacillus halophilus]